MKKLEYLIFIRKSNILIFLLIFSFFNSASQDGILKLIDTINLNQKVAEFNPVSGLDKYKIEGSYCYYLEKISKDSAFIVKRSLLNTNSIKYLMRVNISEEAYFNDFFISKNLLIISYFNNLMIYKQVKNKYNLIKSLNLNITNTFTFDKFLVFYSLKNTFPTDGLPCLFLYKYDLQKFKIIKTKRLKFSGIQYTHFSQSNFITASKDAIFMTHPLEYNIYKMNLDFDLEDSLKLNLNCFECDTLNKKLVTLNTNQIKAYERYNNLNLSIDSIKFKLYETGLFEAKGIISELTGLDTIITRRIQKIYVIDSVLLVAFHHNYNGNKMIDYDFINLKSFKLIGSFKDSSFCSHSFYKRNLNRYFKARDLFKVNLAYEQNILFNKSGLNYYIYTVSKMPLPKLRDESNYNYDSFKQAYKESFDYFNDDPFVYLRKFSLDLRHVK